MKDIFSQVPIYNMFKNTQQQTHSSKQDIQLSNNFLYNWVINPI